MGISSTFSKWGQKTDNCLRKNGFQKNYYWLGCGFFSYNHHLYVCHISQSLALHETQAIKKVKTSELNCNSCH